MQGMMFKAWWQRTRPLLGAAHQVVSHENGSSTVCVRAPACAFIRIRMTHMIFAQLLTCTWVGTVAFDALNQFEGGMHEG